MQLAEVVVGILVAVLVGRGALPRGRNWTLPCLSQDLALGLTLVVPVCFAWGLAGLPWTLAALAPLGLLLAALSRMGNHCWSATGRESSVSEGASARIALTLCALCFGLSAIKWVQTPLWSWDHFAIWGLKARRIVQDGVLDLNFLKLTNLRPAVPDYPIGLPLTWRFLSPSTPGAAMFKTAHALFAIALAASVYGCSRRLQATRALSGLAAAVLCASPLFWDTESVGLADLPLASLAIAATLMILEGQEDPHFPAWATGAVLGFLSWIKAEGLLLGLLLALLAAAPGLRARPIRDRIALLTAWFAWAAGAAVTRLFLLTPAVGFLAGNWTERAARRLQHPRAIVAALVAELAGREWFGLWFLFGVAAVLVLRRTHALPFLWVVVTCQLSVYALIYLGTRLDPVEHIRSSFHRIASALAPFAILSAMAAFGAARHARGLRKASALASADSVSNRAQA